MKITLNASLIALSAAVTLAGIFSSLASGNGIAGSVLGFGAADALSFLALRPGSSTILSLLGFQFLHAWIVHFTFNAMALADFGKEAERSMGTRDYALLFVFSSIAVSAASLAYYPEGQSVVGISGFAFAVCGFLIPYAKSAGDTDYARSLSRAMAFNFLLTLAVPFLSMTAHMAGFLAGMAFYHARETLSNGPSRA